MPPSLTLVPITQPCLSLPAGDGEPAVEPNPTQFPASGWLRPPAGDVETRPRTAPGIRPTPEPTKQTTACPSMAPPKRLLAGSHRKNACSIDSSAVPRQTIMKALVSRPPPNSQLAISTMRSFRSSSGNENARRARRLSEAISELVLDSDLDGQHGRLSALNSPCFYHKRFDDAVDVDRVLADLGLQDEENLSHSRFVQTATSVREVGRQLQRKPIKTALRNIMIVTKARDNDLVLLTRELAKWLMETPRNGSDVGVNVYVDVKLKASKRFDAASLLALDSRFESKLRFWTPELCWNAPEKLDLVLTLGGDGTVLYTSWLFQRIVPPILSFSLGSLGFLTGFQFSDYRQILNGIMGDAGMRVNLRMRFTCTVYRADPALSPVEAEQFEVLNEVVIDRGPSPYVANLEVYGDGNLLTVVQADGCIFSTPTGSTAYSLSAGGSLVHPDIPAILLTPICPHTLSFRPMLLRDSMALRVAVPRGSRATAFAAFDGKGRVELREGDSVTIVASQYPFPTVLSRETEWFDSISRTLRWNTRGATQKAWDRGAFSSLGGSAKEHDIDAEPEFDIDFGDDRQDSGYMTGEGSSAEANGSPKGRRLLF